ncbi:MAG: hypothetical protein IH991_09335 [Planctomycetes bacterium]|nr:hypothetical protein [Planctomycetota bacterium]
MSDKVPISTMPHGGKWFLVVSTATSITQQVVGRSRRVHTEFQQYWTGQGWSTSIDYAMAFDSQQEALEFRASHRIAMEASL